MKEEIISGIYKIECIPTGKVYIGQSNNLKKRLITHRSLLKNKNHKNDYLQKSYNKYGEDNFDFSVVEKCNIENCDSREIYWINLYDSCNREKGFNHESGGHQNKHHSDETKIKIKNIKIKEGNWAGEKNPKWGKGYLISGNKNPAYGKGYLFKGINNHACRKLICVNTCEIFDYILLASEKYNIDNSAITKCCRSKQKYAGIHPETGEKLVWMYYDEYIIKNEDQIKFILYKGQHAKIFCITTKEIFDTQSEAGIKYNIDQCTISNCCKGKVKSAGKHPITGEKMVWMFYDEYKYSEST